MIRTVEDFNLDIVITNVDGTRIFIPKLNVNINVPTAGNDIYLQTTGTSYAVDYTSIQLPNATSKADLAEQINHFI